jgi:putative Holliday junction resolvase
MTSRGRVLGLDFGSRRIGVAITDSDQTVATGVAMIERGPDRSSDHVAIAGLVKEYDAVRVVVGLPVSLSGGNGAAALAVLEEVDQLQQLVGIGVDTIDERFTTAAASSAMRRGGRSARAQRAVIDQAAAAVLLQDWIDRRRPRGGAPDD